MIEKMKFAALRVMGSMLSLVALLWMPWRIRVAYAKFLYRITYVDPKKYPTYMKFIETCNARYDMGKRTPDAYKNIVLVKEGHEKDE